MSADVKSTFDQAMHEAELEVIAQEREQLKRLLSAKPAAVPACHCKRCLDTAVDVVSRLTALPSVRNRWVRRLCAFFNDSTIVDRLFIRYSGT